jgi:hypothetical protein
MTGKHIFKAGQSQAIKKKRIEPWMKPPFNPMD